MKRGYIRSRYSGEFTFSYSYSFISCCCHVVIEIISPFRGCHWFYEHDSFLTMDRLLAFPMNSSHLFEFGTGSINRWVTQFSPPLQQTKLTVCSFFYLEVYNVWTFRTHCALNQLEFDFRGVLLHKTNLEVQLEKSKTQKSIKLWVMHFSSGKW